MVNIPKTIPFENDLTKKANLQLHFGFFDLLPIRGNKWFKLKYNVETLKNQKFDKLLTFGGAYSNHLLAAAEAGVLFGFQTIGIVRGEKILPLNPILSACEKLGMRLHFISRSEYREKKEANFIQELKEKFGDVFILPEGGSNADALRGCMEIADYFEEKFNYYCLSAGTGGTSSGLAIEGNLKNFKVEVFSSLKNGVFLLDEMQNLQNAFAQKYPIFEQNANLSALNLHTNYDFGGYAKKNVVLENFINEFYQKYHIRLDEIYTAKMLFGVFDLLEKDYFLPNKKILVLLTKGNERT